MILGWHSFACSMAKSNVFVIKAFICEKFLALLIDFKHFSTIFELIFFLNYLTSKNKKDKL